MVVPIYIGKQYVAYLRLSGSAFCKDGIQFYHHIDAMTVNIYCKNAFPESE